MTERSPIPRPVARKGAGHGVILPGRRASPAVQGGVRAEVLAALYTGEEYWRRILAKHGDRRAANRSCEI